MCEILEFPWSWRMEMRENGYDPDNEEEVDSYWNDIHEEAQHALSWLQENQKESEA